MSRRGWLVLVWFTSLASGLVAPAWALAEDAPLAWPRPGARLAAGSPHVVRWPRGASPREPVNIRFSTQEAGSPATIAHLDTDTGEFAWEVPSTVAKGCRLEVAVGTARYRAEFDVIPSQRGAYEWSRVTLDAGFPPRDGAGALTYRGRMWLLGGWNSGDKTRFPRTCANDVWSSADGATWRLDRPNTFLDATFDPTRDWEGRHTAGYVVHDDTMWIVGGDVNQRHYHHDVWNSRDGKTWTLVNTDKPVPWGPRALHYTVAHRGKIWVMGGQTVPQIAPEREVFHRDVWNSADGVNWEKVATREPYWSPRGMIGGSAVFQGRMWVLGGGTYDTPQHPQRQFLNDVWSSEDGATWTEHTPSAPWSPRQYHDVGVFDGRLWVLEGYNGRNLDDAWYSADGVNWYEMPKPQPNWKPRHAASVFVHDGSLWLVAGNNMEADVWRLRRRDARAGR